MKISRLPCAGGDAEAQPSYREVIVAMAEAQRAAAGTSAHDEAGLRHRDPHAAADRVRLRRKAGENGIEELEIARDRREDLIERISQGSMWDILILSGGVSMGKYDLVEQVLREYDAEFFFTGAWIQPGKPVVFGRIPKIGSYQVDDHGRYTAGAAPKPWTGAWTYFFGLPGNPVSTEVCFRLFVAPMLRALSGQTEIAPQFIEARLLEDVKGNARVTRFLPAIVESDWKRVGVRPVPWQGSGDLAANARANGFVVLPSGIEKFSAGESVRVMLR